MNDITFNKSYGLNQVQGMAHSIYSVNINPVGMQIGTVWQFLTKQNLLLSYDRSIGQAHFPWFSVSPVTIAESLGNAQKAGVG